MLGNLQEALVKDQKLQVTVWDPDDESVEFDFPSYVISASQNYFEIVPPAIRPEKVHAALREGQLVGVVVQTYPNPIIFYPILDKVPATPKSNLFFRIPDNPNIQVMQQRRHVRVPMELPIEVSFQIAGKPMSIKARTEDLSGGGTKFNGSRLFLKGQEIRVKLQISSNQPALELKAKVIFAAPNQVKKNPEDLYATACQFLDVDEAIETLLVRTCFHKELGIKR